MSFIDFLRGVVRAKRDPPVIPMDSDDNGELLYSDDIVTHIKEELERRRDERKAYELKWSLNANFLAGHQNSEIDVYANNVVTEEPVEKVDRERRCYNRIAPLMETRDANLGAVNYDMVVNPRTNEAEDIAKAKVSTALLQYVQSNVISATRLNRSDAGWKSAERRSRYRGGTRMLERWSLMRFPRKSAQTEWCVFRNGRSARARWRWGC